MNITEILNPQVLTITKKDLNIFEKVLHFLGFNIAKEFKVKEPNLYNVYRIASIINKFDIPKGVVLKFEDGILKTYLNNKEADILTHTRFITKNLTNYAKIITLGLQCDNKRLNKRLYSYVINNLTRNELEQVLAVILNGAKLGFFLPTSILIQQETANL